MTRSFCPALTQPAGLEAFSYRKALRKPLALEGEMESEVELMVGPSSGSLDFLRLVYSDPSQSINRRTRAAIAALPFEHPKLCVSANVDPTLALPKGSNGRSRLPAANRWSSTGERNASRRVSIINSAALAAGRRFHTVVLRS